MRGSMAGLLTAGLVAVAVAAGFIELRAFPLNHDAAWYLYVAGAWLDGKRLCYAASSIASWQSLLIRPEVILVATGLAVSAGASAAAQRSAFVAAAFLAEAIASRKGWSYHYYPASAFAVLSLGLSGQLRPSLRLAWGGALAVVAATLALAWPSAGVPRAVIDRSELLRAVDDTREPGAIAVLSPFFSSAWPMVLESARPWAARYPAANFLLTPEPTAAGSALFEEMLTDVRRAQPAILIIDRRISELAPGRGEIGELGLRDKYESRGTVGPLKIYRRVDCQCAVGG